MTRPTRLELAILGLLLEAPRSGYDVRQTFATTPLGNFSGGPGAVYPALARLARRRWIRKARIGRATGRPRVPYELTAAGRDVLVAWLRTVPGPEDVVWDVETQMLKLAFIHRALPKADIERFLAAYARQTRAYARELARHLAALDLPTVPALALEHGIALYQTRARWARHALGRVRKELS